jgi:hypothetical protein
MFVTVGVFGEDVVATALRAGRYHSSFNPLLIVSLILGIRW